MEIFNAESETLVNTQVLYIIIIVVYFLYNIIILICYFLIIILHPMC
jgi:hypothetical protein